MDGPFFSPPAKRSIHTAIGGMHEPSAVAAINGGSSYKRSKPPQPPLTIPAGHVSFRILCHSSRIGGIIGKSGSIIKQLQQETGSKIRIEELQPNSDDHRVVVVIASTALNKKIRLNAAEGHKGDNSCEEIEVSAAQEAVVRVFERIIEVAAESDGVPVVAGGLVSIRLLAETSQAGSVIGKGGKVVEKIRKDTGCKIKVLTSEKLLASALPGDEIVEIEGDILAVKKALIAVSCRLQDCPPADKSRMIGSRSLESVLQEALADQVDLPLQRNSVLQPMPTSSVNYSSGGRALSLEHERIPIADSKTSQHEVVFRILCSSDRVGGVIGKGGSIIRALQSETGATISIGPPVTDCDDRLITVTSIENPGSQYSPAQRAVVLVFSRSVEVGAEKGLDSGAKGSFVSAQIVVSPNEAGCLLGKGGKTVAEMRKVTGASIRIIGGDQVPKCASDKDEVVQITGEFVNVQDALYNATGRLRDNQLPTKMLNGAGSISNPSTVTGISPYGRSRDTSSFGLHSSLCVNHSLNHHSSLTQSMDHLGLSSNSEYAPSSRLLSSERVTGVNSRSAFEIDRGLSSFRGGIELGSGSRSAIVTNTTVEILVPEHVIGCVYGENGTNLTRLRQISGAKVEVHEPGPGTTDRIVIISGTPDETQAAQSLLQAFILTEPL